MLETWDEYAEPLRQDLYRLNMELSHWEAHGNGAMVTEIKALIAQISQILESEKHK